MLPLLKCVSEMLLNSRDAMAVVVTLFAQDVRGIAIFFFKISCVLIPKPYCSPCYLGQNRPSVPQQGSVFVEVLSQVWLVGPCQHHWNVTSHFYLLTSPYRKWQLVGSDRSGQGYPMVERPEEPPLVGLPYSVFAFFFLSNAHRNCHPGQIQNDVDMED